jgi:signal transduction histidine kinase
LPLADAVRQRDLLLLPDRATILARYPSLAGELAVQAAAIVPFLLEATPLGAMSLTFSQSQTFGAADREFLWAMGRQCAQALDRAQAFSTLQERVRERSQALETANARLQREAQEREQAQLQLSASYDQLRALTADLQGAREEERRHLSRELHDEFGGTLTGLKMDVARLQRAWPQKSAELAALSAAIDAAVQKVRGIATELRPAVLDDFGPVAAIEGLVQDFRTRMGIDCELVAERDDLNLASDANIGVYRIVQECLTNISRHAHATRVTVSLTDEAAGLVLRVQDDGQGFVVAEALRGHTLGLAGLRERVHALAGRLAIDSRPGEGTTITVTIPKPAADARP